MTKHFLVKIYSIWGKKVLYHIIALQGTKKLQRFLWWKCCFFAPIQLVFPFFLPPWAQHYSSMLLCSCSYMYLVATKKNDVKISTQSIATVDWMGTVFSPKMSLFFLASQLCSPICSTSKWPNDLIFVFGVHRHAIGSTKVDIQFGDIGF